MRKCRQKDLTGCNQSVVGTAPNSSLNNYICVQFAKSGALSDYHVQMEEWLDILEDPSIENAELPAMNDQQGPFMLMVPLADKDAWSSSVYARYYGKESVICVPRKTDG